MDFALDGTTVVKATTRIQVDAPVVELPTASFTSTGATLQSLDVTGATTMSTLTANDVTASTSVTTPLLTVSDPVTDTLDIIAASVAVQGDLQVTGTIGTSATSALKVQNNVVQLGVSPTDVLDTSRDAAGIVVPGIPEYLPEGKIETNYEHSIRWKRNEGDFSTLGETMAPHQKPRWTFSGGCVSISDGRASEWFIAPHTHPDSGEASLGIYFQIPGTEAKLIQRFVSEA
jgi:hypothetical protein